MTITLDAFASNLRNEIHRDADVEDEETFLVNAFTRRFLDMLAEAGEIADADVCYYAGKSARLNAVCADDDDDTLDLFVCIHLDRERPAKVEKSKIDNAVRQLINFYKLSVAGLYSRIEEVEPAFAVAQQIYAEEKSGDGFSRIRLFLLTDGLVNYDRLPDPPELGDALVSIQVWDIERLYRWYSSGHDREEIAIDVAEFSEDRVHCLVVDKPECDYVSYLAAIPGSFLVGIYAKYGPRLLEKNVRSFLQAKVATNKGIRETILSEPGRFLAYNNGITATAATVEIKRDGAGPPYLKRITDLQIVNGGQTTASLFRAVRKDKAEGMIPLVTVQMKLNTVRDPAHLDQLVGRISRFANTQNKVSNSDLSANDPFHIRLEALSRTVWAPAGAGGRLQTKWFYERARKQYADELDRAGTTSKKSKFEREYPKSQMFTKTDLAKYDLSWDQMPHVVSKGAQKCFAYFADRIAKRGASYVPDEAYFRGLVARKILFDSTDALVKKREFGGYKANVVTYAIALLSHATARRVDLERIWKDQRIDTALESFLDDLAVGVYEVISSPPSHRRNITEWCKDEACWKRCIEIKAKIASGVSRHLVSEGQPIVSNGISGPTEEEAKEIDAVAGIPSETWFAISHWAKKTGTLAPWQRSISFSIGKLIAGGRKPSIKQARQGIKIVEEARRLGFSE